MNIAIVGRSHLSDKEYDKATTVIETIILRAKSNGDKIITGDASGVDNIVRRYDSTARVIESDSPNWKGFKNRNKKIAGIADYVYSITTKLKRQACYHCGEGHERTGGCYTLKIARQIGKKGEVVVI